MNNLSGKRFVITMAVSIVITAAIVVGAFSVLYSVSEKNILDLWQNKTVESARDVDYYLAMPFDAVSFSAMKLNRMISRGASSEEILDYLHDETETYSAIVKENSTGVYAYYKGQYLDGSHWEPPADYEPTERPWYREAYDNGGRITLVSPFMNIQTNTMMMAVSQLLDDGESVVSMDVFLDGVQRMTEDLSSEPGVEAVFVMDKSGFLIAHSEKSFVGQKISDGSTPYGRSLYKKFKEKSGDAVNFGVTEGISEYRVFCSRVNDNWDIVYVLDRYEVFRSLNYIYVIAGVALIIISSVIITYIILFFKRAREAAALSREIRAVADIYVDMAKVDFQNDRMTILRNSDIPDEFPEGETFPFRESITRILTVTSAEQSMDMLMRFIEEESLKKSLSKSDTLAHEYLNNKNQWVRLRFIVVDRDESGEPVRALMALASIDEDKRSQERLRRLSETDMMTGIRNRGSGEALVKKALSEGTTGLFVLLDADNFKSINDDFGHHVGDKVIVSLADSMVKTFRDSDVVFRLGGDEFAAFAKGVCDEEIARKIIDRLFKNTEGIDIPEFKDRKLYISVGATVYSADRSDSFDAIYERADAATYESKKTEGNTFTFRGYEAN